MLDETQKPPRGRLAKEPPTPAQLVEQLVGGNRRKLHSLVLGPRLDASAAEAGSRETRPDAPRTASTA
jgi:hypothetical protein